MVKAAQARTLESAVGIEQLARQYREPLLRHFVRRGLQADVAEDCVQDVFVRIANVDLAAVKNSEAYLFAIASNVQIDRARRSRVREEGKHDPIENFSLASGDPSPARVFENKEALLRLDRILHELPDRTREVFLLNRLDGLSYTQLAARYRVSVGSIEKRMAKALVHLRKRLQDDEQRA